MMVKRAQLVEKPSLLLSLTKIGLVSGGLLVLNRQGEYVIGLVNAHIAN